MKKLEQDALRADLAATESLLDRRTEIEDPIGWRHFHARRDAISLRLSELDSAMDTTASVALFFGGRPVFGSHGIEVDFGGQALQRFQTAVSTRLTEQLTSVGSRGPLPQWSQGQMLLTDIARGSMGFVIEEASTPTLVQSDLKIAVHDVVDLINQLTSPNEEAFQSATEDADNRLISSIKDFIQLLDDKGATLRIVEGERDLSLHRDAIEIAARRVEDLQIDEDQFQVTGPFYLLPDSRRFEIHSGDNVYRGRVDAEIVSSLLDERGEALPGIIGEVARVTLARRRVTVRGREPRFSYRLVVFAPLPGSIGRS